MTHLIRTTLRPDEEIEVGDAEYLDLQRDGLLIADPVPAADTPPPAAPAAKKAAAAQAASKES